MLRICTSVMPRCWDRCVPRGAGGSNFGHRFGHRERVVIMRFEAGCSRSRCRRLVVANRRMVVASHPETRCGSRMWSAIGTGPARWIKRRRLARPGERLAAADAVQHAAVAVGDLDNIQPGARDVGACVGGKHVLLLLVCRSSDRATAVDSTNPAEAEVVCRAGCGGGQLATEVRSRFSPLSGFSQVASPQNCWSVRPPAAGM